MRFFVREITRTLDQRGVSRASPQTATDADDFVRLLRFLCLCWSLFWFVPEISTFFALVTTHFLYLYLLV